MPPLIAAFLVLCMLAIFYWGGSQLPLPRPVFVAVMVLASLLGLAYVASLFGYHLPGMR
jgi:hypothetical protein